MFVRLACLGIVYHCEKNMLYKHSDPREMRGPWSRPGPKLQTGAEPNHGQPSQAHLQTCEQE